MRSGRGAQIFQKIIIFFVVLISFGSAGAQIQAKTQIH